MLSNKTKVGDKDGRLYLQNSVKTLVANIRFASVDNPIHVIALTSSVPNEGKSTISVALSEALAAGGKDVIVVDCDLRRRSLANQMGVHAQYGLYAVLAKQVTLEEAVVKTDVPGLYMLDVEPHIPNPVDILASKRFHMLVEEMRQKFAYVIIDTPPVSTFVDAAVISRVVDGTLFVVRRGFAKRNEIVAAYDQLKKADANIIGGILNFCENERSEYYYSYYNKDGKRVRRSGSSSSSALKLPSVPLSQRDQAPATLSAARPAQDGDAYVAESDDDATTAAAMSSLEPSTPGLRPLPEVDYDAAADSTMAFLAQSGYKPKTSFDD